MENLYAGLQSAWRKNRLAKLANKAIEKGFRPSEKPIVKKTAVKVTGSKVTKNEIFLSIIRENPGVTMGKATQIFAEKTGSVDKHYNLTNKLVSQGILRKGPVVFGKGDYGIYFA